MAIAAANCWFSAVTSTGCAAANRLFSTSHRPAYLSTVRKPSDDQNRSPFKGKPRKSSVENEVITQKFSIRARDENTFSNADGRKDRNKAGRSQSAPSKSLVLVALSGAFLATVHWFSSLKSNQISFSGSGGCTVLTLHRTIPFLGRNKDSILVLEGMSEPPLPERHISRFSFAFMIGDGKLLTNAHCVEHNTQVKVKRRGDDTKYVAKVLARGVECDIALLSVESKEFWQGTEPLHLGRLPNLQDSVTVVGYPLGGETISVSKGVVSRIEVTSYAHGSSELLGIQIDAAINPGNSGGPAFNDQGECIGVAFQVYRSDEVENIGYVIPSTVVSHFLEDYERNGKYTGELPFSSEIKMFSFSWSVIAKKLENPALRACLNVPTNEGVLVRKVEPTSHASTVLKEGMSLFSGDVAELGVIRGGQLMKVQVILNTRVHLVPYHIEGDQPSYLIVAGLVFTPLSEPLIEEECEDSIGLRHYQLKLLTKARYSMPKFKGEQIVVLSQVLANEVNIGYEDMSNEQASYHLSYLRESALAASKSILKGYGIPSERSEDLLVPYVDSVGQNEATNQHEFGDTPVSNRRV
ncbi:hypothetical protein DH2020_001634 [Rehmannia glutinosa]|uniref:Protease Do-like PDZ domain-containing protein n=1 Tax=Rehmannia glutinosa TaxID=99300 RepID=A0ABR0XZX5_REHGL